MPSLAASFVTVPAPKLAVQMFAPSKATPSGSSPTEKLVVMSAAYQCSKATLSGLEAVAMAGADAPRVCVHPGDAATISENASDMANVKNLEFIIFYLPRVRPKNIR